jgi:hypothetical protein
MLAAGITAWRMLPNFQLAMSVQPHAADDLLKAGVAAYRIKDWNHLDVLQDIRLFLAGTLKPGKCFIVVAESQIGLDKRTGRDVAGLLALLQFLHEPERIRPSPGASVRPDQRTDNSGASIGKGSRLLKHRDCLFGLVVEDERPSKIPKDVSAVRLYGQRVSGLFDRFVVTMCVNEDPYDVVISKWIEFAGSSGPGECLLPAFGSPCRNAAAA